MAQKVMLRNDAYSGVTMKVIKGQIKRSGHLSVLVLQFIFLKLIVFAVCQEA